MNGLAAPASSPITGTPSNAPAAWSAIFAILPTTCKPLSNPCKTLPPKLDALWTVLF